MSNTQQLAAHFLVDFHGIDQLKSNSTLSDSVVRVVVRCVAHEDRFVFGIRQIETHKALRLLSPTLAFAALRCLASRRKTSQDEGEVKFTQPKSKKKRSQVEMAT